MTSTLNILLAQVSARVGDIAANAARVRKVRDENPSADLIVFPELHLAGYPPEDLVLKPAFIAECRAHAQQLAAETARGPALLVGLPWEERGKLYNALALMQGGKITDLRFKHDLPNYGVFDEKRVFASAPFPEPVIFKGIKIGVPICEDIWQDSRLITRLRDHGAELLIAPHGSPFCIGKFEMRRNVVARNVRETGLPLMLLNRVGGQDELVFDGGSFGLCGEGGDVFQFPAFKEHIAQLTWTKNNGAWRCDNGSYATLPDLPQSLYEACCLGFRDYVHNNGFKQVVLGLSGGIDSALVAAICADTLGPENVHALMLPSRFTSQHSLDDAAACAKALGIKLETVLIEESFKSANESLAPVFAGKDADVTEENLQSRLRGLMLMAYSNKFGTMLVTTGNKSEMSVGYATLYGDMNGGFNPIKDLYKTQVYELAKWRNARSEVIPHRILTKAPSAELRADQTDQDSLPAYDILDGILERLIEREMSVLEIAREGYDLAIIKRVENMLALAEYKRRQAPPGVKVTQRSFGRDRRYPITNGWRDEGRAIPDDETVCSSPVCYAKEIS